MQLWMVRVALCLCVLSGACSVRADGESWRDRFLSEAPKQWDKYLDGCKLLQGEMVIGGVRDGKEKITRSLQFKQNADCALFLSGTSAVCSNKHYAFRLVRRHSEAPWVVANIVYDLRNIAEMGPLTPRQSIQTHLQNTLLNTNGDLGLLQDLLKGSDFQVGVAEKAGEFVRVEFRTRPKNVAHPQNPRVTRRQSVTGGWLLLDPARYWLPIQMGVDTELTGLEHTEKKYEYGKDKDGFPLLVKGSGFRKDAKDTENNHAFTRCKFERRGDVADSEFTLSAFGFPEPARIGMAGPAPWYLVSGLAGLTCVAAGAFLSRRRLV